MISHFINSRRKRRAVGISRPGAARPIDKELIVVAQSATTSLLSTTLKSTTFPCTIVGLRWSFSIRSVIASGDSIVSWAIVTTPDGEAANTPSQSNGADFYTPEQNVMAFGVAQVRDTDAGSGPVTIMFEGTTKTMRKLKQGDLLQFISISNVASSASINGVIQFFCKS